MSTSIDPTEGLCSICSTIRLADSPYWEFEHATVPEVLYAARRGCAFCFILAVSLPMLQTIPAISQSSMGIKLVRNGLSLGAKVIAMDLNWEEEHQVAEITMGLSLQTSLMGDVVCSVDELPAFRSLLAGDDTQQRRNRGISSRITKIAKYAGYSKEEPPVHIRDFKLSAVANKCLEKCVKEHRCGPKGDVILPTRVIDVGILDDPVLKLFVSNSPTPGRYAALSYCWGMVDWSVTTSANIEQRREGFPLETLPRTLRDAVGLTRALGLRYIWIDALCIIQGDDKVAVDDWKVQVTKMERIYGDAFITISAAASTNANTGLFTQGSCLLPQPDGRYLRVHKTSTENFAKEPINRRAWTMQEHLLSPRLIIWTSSGPMWHCDEALLSNTMMSGMGNLSSVYKYRLLQSQIPNWTTLVENFSGRDLTKEGDKLHAFAALARKYNMATNDVYCAGLWKSKLLEHLTWFHDRDWVLLPKSFTGVSRPKVYRAPTWSWASIDAVVRYPNWITTELRYPCRWLSEATCTVQLANPADSFGAVLAGLLILRGPMMKGKIKWATNEIHKYHMVDNVIGGELGIIWPDDEDGLRQQLQGGVTVWCIALYAPRDNYSPAEAIAMRPSQDTPGTYERVGVVLNWNNASMYESVWKDAVVQTVTLV